MCRSTGPRWCSSTPGGWPSSSPISSASGSATARSRPTTAACRRTAGSGSRPGCATVTCGRWWRPRRWSWASTSGPVELVCQIGSPRSFATFLQRVGRSNHTRNGVPAGLLYPTTRDELVECAALMRGARSGRLDRLRIPAVPAGHPGPAGRGRMLSGGMGCGATCWRWPAARRRSRRCPPRTSRTSPSWCRKVSEPAAAAGRPTCTGIR